MITLPLESEQILLQNKNSGRNVLLYVKKKTYLFLLADILLRIIAVSESHRCKDFWVVEWKLKNLFIYVVLNKKSLNVKKRG